MNINEVGGPTGKEPEIGPNCFDECLYSCRQKWMKSGRLPTSQLSRPQYSSNFRSSHNSLGNLQSV